MRSDRVKNSRASVHKLMSFCFLLLGKWPFKKLHSHRDSVLDIATLLCVDHLVGKFG